jgi:predicted nucleic acid-binding protein
MNYFFDTNVISRLAKKDPTTIEHLQSIASDPESAFFVNRLVYLESLRAIPSTHSKLYNATKTTLDMFVKIDMTQEIYDRTIEFARFCKSRGINLGKCEAIDYLHFITAKHYKMEIISYDGDIERLQVAYQAFIA